MPRTSKKRKSRYESSEYKRSRPKPRDRECLRCGVVFKSTGAGNRLCPTCAAINRRVDTGTYNVYPASWEGGK